MNFTRFSKVSSIKNMGEMGSIGYAGYIVPVLVLLVVAEYYLSRKKKIDAYSLSDTLVNFCCGILERTFDFFFVVFLYFLFDYLYAEVAFFHLDNYLSSGVLVFILALLASDFLAYWHHRLSHEINFMWAAHIVHHQSEELNITTVFRVSAFAVINRTFFWIWLPFMGFSPEIATGAILFIGLYQFVSHTRLIKKMGIFEHFMVTPSHHRVHHARNPKYIDKNYGHVFIFWDKMFGTFQPEEEDPEFGIIAGFESSNPVWAYFYYWVSLFKRAGQTKSWKNKIKIFFMPPDWQPEDVPLKEQVFETDENGKRVKYRHSVPVRLQVYLIANLLLTLTIFVYLLISKDLPMLNKLQLSSMVVLSVISFGPLLERKIWGARFDLIKLILIAVNVPIFFWSFPNASIVIGIVLAIVISFVVWLQRLRTKVEFT